MLSCPVYTESHPRRNAAFAARMNLRDAAHAAPCISFKSFNSFTFNGLRTLLAQWSDATPVFSDASGLFPLPWGCIPPRPIFIERISPSPLYRNHSDTGDSTQSNVFSLILHGPRVADHGPRPSSHSALRERKKSAPFAQFCAPTPLLATHAHFMRGGG
jgi:hypothetical protein